MKYTDEAYLDLANTKVKEVEFIDGIEALIYFENLNQIKNEISNFLPLLKLNGDGYMYMDGIFELINKINNEVTDFDVEASVLDLHFHERVSQFSYIFDSMNHFIDLFNEFNDLPKTGTSFHHKGVESFNSKKTKQNEIYIDFLIEYTKQPSIILMRRIRNIISHEHIWPMDTFKVDALIMVVISNFMTILEFLKIILDNDFIRMNKLKAKKEKYDEFIKDSINKIKDVNKHSYKLLKNNSFIELVYTMIPKSPYDEKYFFEPETIKL